MVMKGGSNLRNDGDDRSEMRDVDVRKDLGNVTVTSTHVGESVGCGCCLLPADMQLSVLKRMNTLRFKTLIPREHLS